MLNNQMSRHQGAAPLTYFTHALREQCMANGTASARMRNGEWCKVGYSDGGFHRVDDAQQRWQANGNSTIDSIFDLVEFTPAHDVLANWSPLFIDIAMHKATVGQLTH